MKTMPSSSLPLLPKFVSLGLCAVLVLVFSPLVTSLSQGSLAKIRLDRIIRVACFKLAYIALLGKITQPR